MNPTIYSKRIFYYEEVLPNTAEIVALIESTNDSLTDKDAISSWKLWTASDSDDVIFGYQKQTDYNKLATSNSNVRIIYNTLTDVLKKVGTHYANTLNLNLVPPSPLSISKYIVGGSMGAHVDDYGREGITPIMSGVIYLNDNAEGGELFFYQQNLTIKPKAGSVVIFPSVEPFYHQSLPVTKGEKYMSPVFWVRRD
jgi:predicted 2-oxoglutarate/Fe(II)-dependent dioxygenase YbiX